MTISKIIYFSALVGRIQTLLIVAITIAIVILMLEMLSFALESDDEEERKKCISRAKRFLKLTIILSLIVVFIPSKNEMLCISITKGYKKEAIYQMTKKELRDNIDYLVNSLKAVKENKND